MSNTTITKIFNLTKEISQLVEIDNMEYSHITMPVLFVRNIQKILIGLDLGENPDYEYFRTRDDFDQTCDNFECRTQAKVLSDKWFSLREEDNLPIISLWDSSHEGQVQVLEELLEVLKANNNIPMYVEMSSEPFYKSVDDLVEGSNMPF